MVPAPRKGRAALVSSVPVKRAGSCGYCKYRAWSWALTVLGVWVLHHYSRGLDLPCIQWMWALVIGPTFVLANQKAIPIMVLLMRWSTWCGTTSVRIWKIVEPLDFRLYFFSEVEQIISVWSLEFILLLLYTVSPEVIVTKVWKGLYISVIVYITAMCG